jgi:hypothetical protein
MWKEFQQLEWNAVLEDDLRQLVRLAVREDLDRQYDWTTVALVESKKQGRAAMIVREPGIVAGLRAMIAGFARTTAGRWSPAPWRPNFPVPLAICLRVNDRC